MPHDKSSYIIPKQQQREEEIKKKEIELMIREKKNQRNTIKKNKTNKIK